MKKWLSFVIFFIPVFLSAQPFSISGYVLDAETKKVLPGAHVFIDQSSNAVKTDSGGGYSLKDIPVKTFKLVVSLPGYESLAYTATPKAAATTVRFELIPLVDSSGFTDNYAWANWNRVFISNFIGTTENAKHCEIVNPEVLRFKYKATSNELVVKATDMLQIINDGLGYMLYYHLDSFKINSSLQSVNFAGYSYFKNLTTKRPEVLEKWKQRRKEAYNGSLMHFMRSVYSNNLHEQGFELHPLTRIFEGDVRYKTAKKGKDSYLFNSGEVTVNNTKKKFIYIIEKKTIPVDSIRQYSDATKTCTLSYKGVLQVVYKNEKENIKYAMHKPGGRVEPGPQISFLQALQSLSVQPNGSFIETSDLEWAGYMVWGKISEMLPIDIDP